MIHNHVCQFVPASWSSGNAFVSRAEGLRFKSRTGQIGHSVANGWPLLQYFSKGTVLFRRNERRWAP